jgi:protein-glutamine gamma-glutamyltransferase
VPARVVTGYQGAELDPVDGFWVVRQSAAHAWVEYWQPGTGWVRADPTAAAAPARVVRGNRLAPPRGLVSEALGSVSPELLTQLRNLWETIDNRWNQWVLNYARGQQLDLLRDIGFTSPSWEDVALLLIGALSGLAAVGAGWAWWDRNRVDPWVRQRKRLRRTLRRLGIAAAAHDPPRVLAGRVHDRFGDAGAALAALLGRLERQRYARDAVARPQPALTREFIAGARRLRTLPDG